MFREEDHPRDDDGRFTTKNGGVHETPAQILYGKVTKNEREEKERNALLNKVKEKLTPAQILYGTKDWLKKKLEKEGRVTGFEPQIKYDKEMRTMLGEPRYARPVEGKITSGFGLRKSPTLGASSNHKGIDLLAPIGTPVKTIGEGKVIEARAMSGYGNAIKIDHGIIDGKHVVSEYGHLNSFSVKRGDIVKYGQIIAKSGNTGISKGPHLHLTITENGIPVDPRKYIGN